MTTCMKKCLLYCFISLRADESDPVRLQCKCSGVGAKISLTIRVYRQNLHAFNFSTFALVGIDSFKFRVLSLICGRQQAENLEFT